MPTQLRPKNLQLAILFGVLLCVQVAIAADKSKKSSTGLVDIEIEQEPKTPVYTKPREAKPEVDVMVESEPGSVQVATPPAATPQPTATGTAYDSTASVSATATTELEKETEPILPENSELTLAEDKTSPSLEPAPKKQDSKVYVLKGFSFGALAANHNYSSSVSVLLNGSTSAKVSSRTADFLSMGAVVRYSDLAINSMGTDFGLTVANSINHDSANYSAITAMKFEMNLAYSWYLESKKPFYVMAGIGYENVSGKDIERLMNPGGGVAQFGAGMVFTEKLLIEGFYSISRHAVSGQYYDRLTAEAQDIGATSVSFDSAKSNVGSTLFSGRLIYKY